MSRSREEQIRYLVRVVKALLVRAEDVAQGDTEYLRDELRDLIYETNSLLGKIEFDRTLTELREKLHELEGTGP